jgi:hypothetical protein
MADQAWSPDKPEIKHGLVQPYPASRSSLCYNEEDYAKGGLYALISEWRRRGKALGDPHTWPRGFRLIALVSH